MSRQLKQCVFCGASGVKMSNEHAWPNWTRKLFRIKRPTTITGARNSEDIKAGRITLRYPAKDDEMGVKVNVVCKHNCNEKWMSDLETKVEPLLTPLIQGSDSFVAFTPAQQRLIATWTTKTAMVFEFTSEREPFFQFEERDHLRRHLSPPSSDSCQVFVWLARFDASNSSSLSSSMGNHVVYKVKTRDQIIDVHTHHSTMTIGHLIAKTVAVRIPDGVSGFQIQVEKEWPLLTTLLWPVRPVSAWPTRATITTAGLPRFAWKPGLRVRIQSPRPFVSGPFRGHG